MSMANAAIRDEIHTYIMNPSLPMSYDLADIKRQQSNISDD